MSSFCMLRSFPAGKAIASLLAKVTKTEIRLSRLSRAVVCFSILSYVLDRALRMARVGIGSGWVTLRNSENQRPRKKASVAIAAITRDSVQGVSVKGICQTIPDAANLSCCFLDDSRHFLDAVYGSSSRLERTSRPLRVRMKAPFRNCSTLPSVNATLPWRECISLLQPRLRLVVKATAWMPGTSALVRLRSPLRSPGFPASDGFWQTK